MSDTYERAENDRREMHDFIDGLPGLSEEQRAVRKGEWDQKQATILAMHGVTAPASKTPEQVAQERFEQEWQPSPMSPDLEAMVDGEIERLGQLSPAERELLIDRVKAAAGAEFDQLVADAKAAAGDGWVPEIAASLPVLKLFAGLGKFVAARDRALNARR